MRGTGKVCSDSGALKSSGRFIVKNQLGKLKKAQKYRGMAYTLMVMEGLAEEKQIICNLRPTTRF